MKIKLFLNDQNIPKTHLDAYFCGLCVVCNRILLSLKFHSLITLAMGLKAEQITFSLHQPFESKASMMIHNNSCGRWLLRIQSGKCSVPFTELSGMKNVPNLIQFTDYI